MASVTSLASFSFSAFPSSSFSVKSYQDLQRALVSFLDELIEMYPEQGQFVAFRIMLKDQVPITTIQSHFQSKLLPQKESISKREVSFFDKGILFAPLGQGQSEILCQLFHGMHEEDKQAIWRWIDALVALTEKCVKVE